MVLSQRELYIAIATLLVVVLFGLDRLLVSPLLAERADLDQKIAAEQQQLRKATRLLSTSRQMQRQWVRMGGDKLRQDASEAESQVLHSVRDWAQDAGLSLSAVKPERSEKEKGFHKITLRATGAGGVGQVGRFLWRIQTADIPVRITDLQLATRREGTDDLSLQLGISTIYLPADADRAAPRAAGATPREGQP